MCLFGHSSIMSSFSSRTFSSSSRTVNGKTVYNSSLESSDPDWSHNFLDRDSKLSAIMDSNSGSTSESKPDSRKGGPAFYIITVSGGTCLEKTSAGIFDKDCDASAAQQWTIQYGDSPDKVAFQNASNGEWLSASSGAEYGKIDTSSTQQWWTLTKDRENGAVWLKSDAFADAYLCNANGSYVNNNKVYAWPKQLNWTHALTWYLKDANAPGFKPSHYEAEAEAEAQANNEELKKREAALRQKEEEIAAQEAIQKKLSAELAAKEEELKELEKRELALRKKEQELTAQEATQQKLSDQLAAISKELADQQQAATKTENGVSPDNKDAVDRQTELQNRLDDLLTRERDLAAKEAALDEKNKQAADREAKLETRERDSRKESIDNSSQLKAENERLKLEAGHNTQSKVDNQKLKTENQKLKQQLQDIQKRLASAQKQSAAPAHANGPSPDAQELAKLKDENARLRDLVVQRALESHNSEKPKRNPPKLANGSKSGSVNGSSAPSVKAPSTTTAKPPSPPAAKTQDLEVAKLRAENARLENEIKNIKGPANTTIAQKGSGAANISKPLRQTNGAAPKLGASSAQGAGKQQSESSGKLPSLDQLRDEHARLTRQREQLLKKQKAYSELSSAAAKGVATGAGALYNKPPKVAKVDGNDDAVEFDCGHVLYAPPRKIERKVVGILYE